MKDPRMNNRPSPVRVAARFLSAALMDKPEEALEDLKSYRPKVDRALTIAKRLESGFGKYETRANEIRKESEDIIEGFMEAAKDLDPKKIGPYLAAAGKFKGQLPGAPWHSFLRYNDPFTEFTQHVSGEIPRKLRAYLAKNRGTPAVTKLEKFYKEELMPFYAKGNKIRDDFKEEYDDGGYEIYELIKYLEIYPPSDLSFSFANREGIWGAEGLRLMQEYNTLQDKAKGNAPYLANGLEDRTSGLVRELERMGEILDELGKIGRKALFGS